MQSSQKHTTAVLVFANSSKEELEHKAIAKGHGLFDTLTKHTLETVRKTGLPYFHFTEKQQIGDSFGERFINAIQAVFDQGYETIITLGNDTPRLKKHHINEAKEQLRLQKTVLGPSLDGGFYLMGLHRSQFKSDAFRQLPWQTSGLLKAICTVFSDSGDEIHQLRVLSDIDTQSDLALCYKINSGLHKALVQLLRTLFILRNNPPAYTENYRTAFYGSSYHNKGSPILLYS